MRTRNDQLEERRKRFFLKNGESWTKRKMNGTTKVRAACNYVLSVVKRFLSTLWSSLISMVVGDKIMTIESLITRIRSTCALFASNV